MHRVLIIERRLFARFVETLGATEFLSAVAMLLLDKAGQTSEAADLPLAVVESFSVEVQLSVRQKLFQFQLFTDSLLFRLRSKSWKKFLDLCYTLVPLSSNSESFFDFVDQMLIQFVSKSSQDFAGPIDQRLSLITFISATLESKQLSAKVDAARAAKNQAVDTSLSEIVRSLLDISALPVPDASPADIIEFSDAVSEGLEAAVRLMSTQSFSEAILWLLDLEDAVVRSSALILLRARLPTIKVTRRADISPAVIAVVARIQTSLEDEKADLESALSTLEVVATSVHAEEDAVLAKTLPTLIIVASRSSVSDSIKNVALSIIKKLSYVFDIQLEFNTDFLSIETD